MADAGLITDGVRRQKSSGIRCRARFWAKLSSMKYLTSFPGIWSGVAKQRALSLAIAALIPLIGRLLLLPLLPIPVPSIHDEFSNLLAANTFAMGRLTNPTPPMWIHFETFHELMQPTYMSVYPPGQGAMLALGKILFGHPWWAVYLSVGVMCALLTWMLQAWLPPAWALMGGVLAGLQFGFAHYWINMYWGASLAAIGGCLVLGALPRLKKNLRPSYALAFAFGLMILASTRPYEGLLLSLAVAAALAQWLFHQDGAFLRRVFLRAVLPSLAVIVPIGCLLMAQNRAVTGSAFKFPHEVFRHEVAVWPTFVWEQPRDPPVYAHEVMRKFFVEDEPEGQHARDWGTLRGLIPGIRGRFQTVGASYFPGAPYLLVALASLTAALTKRVRWLGIAVLTVFAGFALVRWTFPHYLAPIMCALMAIHLQFLRYLRVWRWKGKRIGAGAYGAILCLLLMLFAVRIYSRTVHNPVAAWAPIRESIRQRLESTPGKHLILVRYHPDHNAGDEWVFNEPDIPAAKVIWARAMTPELDGELESYFGDRSVWEVDADANPPTVVRK